MELMPIAVVVPAPTPTPSPRPQPGPAATGAGSRAGEVRTFPLPKGVQMESVWIEPGTFTRGSPSSESRREKDEGPQHEVTISRGFWLGKYEVTQEQWEAVLVTRPWAGWSCVQANPRCPAVCISWDDVQQLVGRLNVDAGPGVYRLPTEAEWEYACRAGTTTRWSFGEDERDLGDYAWYYGNAWNAELQYAQPVGTKLPNPWGLFDMHGNVWEWCQDAYASYPSAAVVDDPAVLGASGSYRVFRGGSFGSFARSTRSAFRRRGTPDDRYVGMGVRLLRTP